MAVSYRVTGAGANGGRANGMVMLVVDIKLDDQIPRSKKTDLQVVVEGPSQTTANVMGGERGKYTVGLKVGAAGTYWVDFVFQGIFAKEPFKLPVSEGSNCPDFPYEGKQRALGAPAGSSPASPGSLQKSDAERQRDDEEERERQRIEEEERQRKEAEEKERLRLEDEERQRKEAEEREKKRIEEERLRKEAEEKARVAAIRSEIAALSIAQLGREIGIHLERLQFLVEEQQKRIASN